MTAKQVAKITGISVRTLHHYDEIKLLSPKRNRENNYREYTSQDLDYLQQILFFRECGFKLEKIKALLENPRFDKEKAFDLQEKYLLHERKRTNQMLSTLRKTRRNMKGEQTMSQKEKFEGFDFSVNPYEEEARRLWGDDVVEQSSKRIDALSKEEQNEITQSMNTIFRSLASVKDENPTSETAQKAIQEMYQFFNANFGYHYTPEAFAGLGEMYVADERFTKNIDKFGDGLSAFLAAAMGYFAKGK